MATRGAVVVAQRNLLEIVKGVQVSSETTVENLIATNDKIVTRIEGIVKGAEQIGNAVEKDGLIEVRMRMPLYATDGLAPAIVDALPPIVDSAAQPEENNDPNSKPMEQAVPSKGLAFSMGGKKLDPALFPLIVGEDGKVLLDTRSLYNPKKGNFPRYVNMTKEALAAAGLSKQAQLLDVLSSGDGKITVSDATKSKIPWQKILNTVKTVGKFLLLLI
jgi:hypothetical protein